MKFSTWYSQLLLHAATVTQENPMSVQLDTEVAISWYKRGYTPEFAYHQICNPTQQEVKNGAWFSPCRKYRYQLWRIWDDSKPLVTFIGLNPSTANESENDATIRVVEGYAKRWGMGGVFMVNCFGFISTDPADLVPLDSDPVNDYYIMNAANRSAMVVFAWGSFKVVKDKGRDMELARLYPNAQALRVNKDGSPHHPLYLPIDIQPVPYSCGQISFLNAAGITVAQNQ